MKQSLFTSLLTTLQGLLALRVLWRMLQGLGGQRLVAPPASLTLDLAGEQVAIIVPVLNEVRRLTPCLNGLLAQGSEVCTILVVDGGSDDGTQALVARYAQADPRVRLIDASPVPSDWNGKAWGLQKGLEALPPGIPWLLTLDADVYPRARLAETLVAHAQHAHLAALSIATLQDLGSLGEGLLHPALLTTLVYRFGIPGHAFRSVHEVQANGQCFLFQRSVLEEVGGFISTRYSVCEDITIARLLVSRGPAVGFYEAGDLISVRMYEGAGEVWRNWPRSLPMHDHFSGLHTLGGWLEVALIQALPLPLCLLLLLRAPQQRWLLGLNGFLALMRIGVLFGTARTYRQRPWSYWLSPLLDLPVTYQLALMSLRRRHRWRGRSLIRGSNVKESRR